MLYPTVSLDAHMTVSAALARLARYGLWMQPTHDAARAWIAEIATAAAIPFDEMARRLARDPREFRVAIRRQWHSSILWYSRPAIEVLAQCGSAHASSFVSDALGLHEPDSREPLMVDEGRIDAGAEGVVLAGSTPLAVSGSPPQAAEELKVGDERGFAEAPAFRKKGRKAGGPIPSPKHRGQKAQAPMAEPARTISGFPRIDAPGSVAAEERFVVRVGIARERTQGTKDERIVVAVAADVKVVDIDVELAAEGLVADGGWTRTLSLDVDDPTAASVEFALRGKPPDNPENIRLTKLEIRYVFKGAVCGFATRPLVIGPAGMPAPAQPSPAYGTPWAKQHVVNSSIDLAADHDAADLTIEILKPDGNSTNGRYVCKLYSRHALKTPRGELRVDVGDDAKTFAKETIDQVRLMTGRKSLEDMVRARSRLIANRLPKEVFDALREVAEKVSPQPPTVLIVSAEQFVPWELAEVAPPLDPTRPGLLGAQAIVGRWLREDGARPSPIPPLNPVAAMGVPSIAVMIGRYAGANGFNALPFAEKEATEMTQAYGAVVVDADDDGLHQLLSADVPPIGPPGAIHFAGHGEYDPTRKDSSVMFLSDGTPMDSLFFRGAKYGAKTSPLIFMNACMIGVGGEVLGAAGGFPGNCLCGGFGAFVGALWEVNDRIAHDIALEFWKRALPADGSEGESIGDILRDMRARYSPQGSAAPVPTYLAYVYYGHPRLRLRKAA